MERRRAARGGGRTTRLTALSYYDLVLAVLHNLQICVCGFRDVLSLKYFELIGSDDVMEIENIRN